MLIDRLDYERCLGGFTITDCTIRNSKLFYFVAVSDYEVNDARGDDERTTRAIMFSMDRPADKRWGYVTYQGAVALLAGAAQQPFDQFVGVDLRGKVATIGGGLQEVENDIPRTLQGPRRGAVMRTRTIDGFLHVATGNRGLARREGKNQWTSLCASLTFDPDPDVAPDEYGFEDMDAFDAGDIYCVGGNGDVWHFNGTFWTQIPFPSKTYLTAVCCAADGWVYLGASGGMVWKGRGDQWKLIHDARVSIPFKDICWFKDRLYCTSDYGLWEIVSDELRETGAPAEITICSGNLAVADGVLLLAGAFGAAYYDGQVWRGIFNSAAFSV